MKANSLLVAALAVSSVVSVMSNVMMMAKVDAVEEQVVEIKRTVKTSKVALDTVKSDNTELKKSVEKLQKVVLYKTKDNVKLSKKEIDCLAKNIFFEAGVEHRAGKVAVAQVTMNRLKDGRWGNDVCKVVYAKAQFSWTLDKAKRDSIPKGELWEESVKVANEFVNKGVRVKDLDSAQHYHTDYIAQPNWAQTMKVTHRIGQHVFYKNI